MEKVQSDPTPPHAIKHNRVGLDLFPKYPRTFELKIKSFLNGYCDGHMNWPKHLAYRFL